jgi:serine/threonine protein kinase
MGILIVSTNILTSAAPAMSYCISPTCPAPDKNSPTTNFCMSCGAKILLKDRYRALKLLGQGGFGKTFKAVDEDQPRKPLCVIKQFAFSNNHPETRQIALKLFYEEAQHLEALGKHDQIPELHAYFDVEGQPYLVQQFIDGQDLEQELATAGTFSQTKIRELLESLLPVLDFLHHQSPPVIHRDIKPANIIRRRSDGGLVLVDFGAAKQATQSMLAKTGTAIGSAEFAAPEQARRKPAFASDIYSLGVTCIYLLTQVSPFDLFDMNQDTWVWRDYLVDNPVDEKLGNILDKMIANNLCNRYQSATNVIETLTGFKNQNIKSNSPFISADKIISTPLLIHSSLFSEIIEFEIVGFRLVEKIVKKKIFKKEGFIFKRLVEHEIDRTVHVREDQRQKCKALQSVIGLGNNVKLQMIYVPAGSFMTNLSHVDDDVLSSHDIFSANLLDDYFRESYDIRTRAVEVEPFYIGKYPITQKQYQFIMGENPSKFKGDDLPVKNVKWDNAVKFCQKLSEYIGKEYTLPSEHQWCYAVKTRINKTCPVRIESNITNKTTIVGKHPPNGFGLHDMYENLKEWFIDTGHKNHNSEEDSSKLNCSFRVICTPSLEDIIKFRHIKS